MEGDKDDKEEVKSADDVRMMHKALMGVFRDYVEVSANAGIVGLASGPSSEVDSWVRTASSEIEFGLIDPNSQEISWRYRGDSVSVMPLARLQKLWVSWYEKWKVVSRGKFALRSVSLTFWQGNQGSVRKDQLIRAEWDHHSNAAKGSGQPHWQIDHPVGIEYAIEPAPVSVGRLESRAVARLEEQTAPDSVWLSISGYHLGMRGDWSAADSSKHGWQNRWRPDGKELHQWLRLCLTYLVQQARDYPAKPWE